MGFFDRLGRDLSNGFKTVNKATGGLAGMVAGSALGPLGSAAVGLLNGGSLVDAAATAIGGKTGQAISAIDAANRRNKRNKKQQQFLDAGMDSALKGITGYKDNIDSVIKGYKDIAAGGDPFTRLANGELSLDKSFGNINRIYDGPEVQSLIGSVGARATDDVARDLAPRFADAQIELSRQGFGNSGRAIGGLLSRAVTDANSSAAKTASDFRIDLGKSRLSDFSGALKTRDSLLTTGAGSQVDALGRLSDVVSTGYGAGMSALPGLGGMYASQQNEDSKAATSLGGEDPYKIIKDEVGKIFGKKRDRNTKQSTTPGTLNAGSRETSTLGDYDNFDMGF